MRLVWFLKGWTRHAKPFRSKWCSFKNMTVSTLKIVALFRIKDRNPAGMVLYSMRYDCWTGSVRCNFSSLIAGIWSLIFDLLPLTVHVHEWAARATRISPQKVWQTAVDRSGKGFSFWSIRMGISKLNNQAFTCEIWVLNCEPWSWLF